MLDAITASLQIDHVKGGDGDGDGIFGTIFRFCTQVT